MEENPYKTPAAPLEEPGYVTVDEAIERRIRNAWLAGYLSAALTLVMILIYLVSGTSIAGVDAWSLVDFMIVAGLSYGVYRESRICAVLLFAFFALNKIIMWSVGGNILEIPVALVFLWFLGAGIVGTFQFQKAQKKAITSIA